MRSAFLRVIATAIIALASPAMAERKKDWKDCGQSENHDLTIDGCTRVLKEPRESQQDRALAYVRTAVVNGCRSMLRRRALARRVAITRAAPWRDTQESAEHTAILAEDRRLVLAALAALPGRRREVLVLRFYLGLPVAEVAAMLGISQGSVKSATARGLESLGRRLGEER